MSILSNILPNKSAFVKLINIQEYETLNTKNGNDPCH